MDIDDLFSCNSMRYGYLDPVIHGKLNGMMIRHGRLHKEHLNSQMYKDYMYQFIFGVLFSIPHDPKSKSMFVVKDLYYRSIDENIRIFSVIGNKENSKIEGIHMHSFFSFSVTGEQQIKGSKKTHEMPDFSLTRGMTKKEYHGIESLLKQTYGVENIASVPITVFEYETTADTSEIRDIDKLPENIHGNDWATLNFRILSNHGIVRTSQQHKKFYEDLRSESLYQVDDFQSGVTLYKIPIENQLRKSLKEYNAKSEGFFAPKYLNVLMEHALSLYKSPTEEGSIKVGEIMPHFRKSQAAMCGFLHGILAATGSGMQPFYVKHQLNSEMNEGQGFFFMEIRPPTVPKLSLVVDFSLQNSRESFGYDHFHELQNKDPGASLALIRVEPIIKQHEQFREEVEFTIDMSEVKFSFAPILGDFIHRLKFKDETESAEVFNEKMIRRYLDHMLSTTTAKGQVGEEAPIMTHFKYFLLGTLRAMSKNLVSDSSLFIGKNIEKADQHSDFDCLMLSAQSEKMTPNLIFKFGTKNTGGDRNFYKKQNLINGQKLDTIILHFYDNDKNKFSIDYTSHAEATRNVQLEEVSVIDIKNTFRIMQPFDLYCLNNRDNTALPENDNLVQWFQDNLKTILKQSEHFDSNDKLSVSEYLNGVFAHFPDASISDHTAEGDINDATKVITIKSGQLRAKSEVTIHFKFEADMNINVAESAVRMAQSFDTLPNNDLLSQVKLAVVYNRAQGNSENLAITAKDPNYKIFNTKNVADFCDRPVRKRRASNPCSLLYDENVENKKEKFSEKVDYSMLDSSLKEIPRLSELRIHIGKIYTASSKLQMGFIARDFVADAIHGDLKGMARDALFFGGAMLADKAGAKLVEKGASLVSQGWKLAGYAATSVGKCLPKIGFDIYMGYQLYTELKNNNTVGAAIDGTMIGIDLLECGLEALAAFGVIALSPVVGEVALIASTILLVGVNIYDAVKKVEHIDEFVHLNAYERGMEGIRAFLHLDPEPSIERLMEEVQANELIMNQILSQNKKFKRFVVNSGILKNETMVSIIENNIIDLRQKFSMKPSRAMPRTNTLNSNNVRLFCEMDKVLQGEESGNDMSFGNFISNAACLLLPVISPLTALFVSSDECIVENLHSSYLCYNAFGFERFGASDNDAVLHILGNGDDSVWGFPNSPNTFSFGNGEKMISGGLRDDTFVLFGNATYGILTGTSQGNNILDLSEYAKNTKVWISSYVNTTFSNKEYKLYKSRMSKIVGRKNMVDIFFYVDCNVKVINLQGGQKEDQDLVFIPPDICPSVNLTVVLSGYTVVPNNGRSGIVNFVVSDEFSLTYIKIYNDIIVNKIIFPHDSLSSIKVSRTLDEFKALVTIKIQIGVKTYLLATYPVNSSTTFLFSDNSTMSLKHGKLVAMLSSDMSLFGLIDSYDDLVIANPDLTVIAHLAHDGEAVVFNHEKITVKDPLGIKREINLIQNHFHPNLNLIGHPNHQNYFFITIKKSKIQRLSDFSLGQVKIYCPKRNNMTNIIDLHVMAMQLFKQTGLELNFTIEIESADIILKLHAMNSLTDQVESSTFGQIRIVNAIIDGQDLNYELYVYGENYFQMKSLPSINRKFDPEVELKPKNFYTNETLLIITPGSIERYTIILFSNWRFYKFQTSTLEFYKMNNTLIVTNIANPDSEEYSTIVFSDYYVNKFKYQTLSIIYEDPIFEVSSDPLYLSLFKEKIDVAPDLKDLWMKLNYEVKYLKV